MSSRTRKSFEFMDAPPKTGMFWNRATRAIEFKIEDVDMWTIDESGLSLTEPFANSGLSVWDTSANHKITLTPGEEAADRVLSIPVLGGADTLMTLGTAQTISGVKTWGSAAYPSVASVTATADGLTTGLIPATADWVNVTSSAAANVIVLPAAGAAMVGRTIRGWVGANGCEMQTLDGSNATINAVDCDGANEAAIPATHYFAAHCVAVDTWILHGISEAGATATITPDADA